METGHLGQAALLSLRGRMQFARSQLSSRASRLCLAAVTRHAVSSASPKLSGAVAEKLRLFADILESSPPRVISSKAAHPWLIFTDASFEPSDPKWPCGLGGVLYDPSGAQVSAFSITLDSELLHGLGHPPKKTVIFEAELLAVVLSLHLWESRLSSAPCVFNSTARDVAISGSARTSPAKELLELLLRKEDSLSIVAWFARVPSTSNPSDAPSRNSPEGIGCDVLEASKVLEVTRSLLSAACSKADGQ